MRCRRSGRRRRGSSFRPDERVFCSGASWTVVEGKDQKLSELWKIQSINQSITLVHTQHNTTQHNTQEATVLSTPSQIIAQTGQARTTLQRPSERNVHHISIPHLLHDQPTTDPPLVSASSPSKHIDSTHPMPNPQPPSPLPPPTTESEQPKPSAFASLPVQNLYTASEIPATNATNSTTLPTPSRPRPDSVYLGTGRAEQSRAERAGPGLHGDRSCYGGYLAYTYTYTHIYLYLTVIDVPRFDNPSGET